MTGTAEARRWFRRRHRAGEDDFSGRGWREHDVTLVVGNSVPFARWPRETLRPVRTDRGTCHRPVSNANVPSRGIQRVPMPETA